MALPYVNVTIANPTNLKRQQKRKLLADSGALYTIVPREVLKAIGVKPYGTETFTLADGSTIRREAGNAFLRIDGRQAPSPVIFGENGFREDFRYPPTCLRRRTGSVAGVEKDRRSVSISVCLIEDGLLAVLR
jgi:predicted aspartyl protease